jgi:hypothetical protein
MPSKARGTADDAVVCAALPILFPRNARGDIWQRKKLAEMQAAASRYPTRKELYDELFKGDNPYNGRARTDVEDWAMWYPSTAVMQRSKIYDLVATLERPPRLIVEVGSFIGTSAVGTWGPLARRSGSEAFTLCVDTWYGDVNMRLGSLRVSHLGMRRKFERSLAMRHGIPNLSGFFLDRVVANNLTQHVFPLAMSSLTAARLLAVANWHADVVYLDSAHEQGETLLELHA